MASCSTICNLISLVIQNLVMIVAFATPFWETDNHGLISGHSGLWAACNDSDCTWIFEDNFRGFIDEPNWFMAVQALNTIGAGCNLLGLLLALFGLCCECKACKSGKIIGGLLIISFLAMGVGITVYGSKQSKAGVEIKYSLGGFGKIFGWSYWLAVSATGTTLFTGIRYICERHQMYTSLVDY